MREIKFRAWDKDEETFYYSDRAYDDHWFQFEDPAKLKAFVVVETGRHDEYGCPITKSEQIEDCQQFTGLHDKNGKEIYEGDSVKFHNGLGETFFGEVQFNDGCFDIVAAFAYPLRDYLKCYTINHAVEVIGNIYEGVSNETQAAP